MLFYATKRGIKTNNNHSEELAAIYVHLVSCSKIRKLKIGVLSRCELPELSFDNTFRLNVEETKAKIAFLEYIQNEWNGVDNFANYYNM